MIDYSISFGGSGSVDTETGDAVPPVLRQQSETTTSKVAFPC
jgi:hypothetical protein